MIIKQLSIFLNNEIGRFTEVTRILAEAGVNLQAFTLSEVSDFGILRLITDNNEKAIAILQENSYAVSTTDVVYIELPDRPGTSVSQRERGCAVHHAAQPLPETWELFH